MERKKAAIEPDLEKVVDRGEAIGLMEPLRLGEDSKGRGEINDLALELAAKSAGLRRSLPPQIADSLAALVRSMNCYYSNLIEGHDTHPIDIERALKEDYSHEAKTKNKSLERKLYFILNLRTH